MLILESIHIVSSDNNLSFSYFLDKQVPYDYPGYHEPVATYSEPDSSENGYDDDLFDLTGMLTPDTGVSSKTKIIQY